MRPSSLRTASARCCPPASSVLACCSRPRPCWARGWADGCSTASATGCSCSSSRPGWSCPACCCWSGLLEELAHPPVGERLAAGLARGAVLQARVGEGDLADGVPAHRAGLPGLGVHGEMGLLLALELAGGQPAGALDRVAQGDPDGVVEDHEVGVVVGLEEAGGGLERRHPRGVQDLVGVGVADTGDGALVAEDALELLAPLGLEDVA